MSTATITKRADELKPGDIIFGDGTSFGNRIVVDAFPATDPHDQRVVVDAFSTTRRCTDRYWLDPNTTVQIESPALTLAQQHAEELLRLVRVASDTLRDFEMTSGSGFTAARKGFVGTASDLLAKIDPPAPPTLEEALESVRVLYLMGRDGNPEALEKAGDLLERARRSGVKV